MKKGDHKCKYRSQLCLSLCTCVTIVTIHSKQRSAYSETNRSGLYELKHFLQSGWPCITSSTCTSTCTSTCRSKRIYVHITQWLLMLPCSSLKVPCWYLLMPYVAILWWTLCNWVHITCFRISQTRHVNNFPYVWVYICAHTYTYNIRTLKSVCFFVPHQANTLDLQTCHYIIHFGCHSF